MGRFATILTMTRLNKKEKLVKTFYQILANTVLANVTNMTVWFALIFFMYLETHSVTATSIVSGIFLVFTAWIGNLVWQPR